jgi:hypothetical protein
MMRTVRNSEGVILNAAKLRVDAVVHQRVLCPACGQKVFERWPLGWDEHAIHQCEGLESEDPQQKLTEFKTAFRHLFR